MSRNLKSVDEVREESFDAERLMAIAKCIRELPREFTSLGACQARRPTSALLTGAPVEPAARPSSDSCCAQSPYKRPTQLVDRSSDEPDGQQRARPVFLLLFFFVFVRDERCPRPPSGERHGSRLARSHHAHRGRDGLGRAAGGRLAAVRVSRDPQPDPALAVAALGFQSRCGPAQLLHHHRVLVLQAAHRQSPLVPAPFARHFALEYVLSAWSQFGSV